MLIKKMLVAAAILLGATQMASAVTFGVDSYTNNSVTFSISGQMPTVNPGTLWDGPSEIDILYTGNLWTGGEFNYSPNSLSGSPIVGDGGLWFGNTGGFGLSSDYSWLYFANDLTGLNGTGSLVTLTWGGNSLLNSVGTGSFDLYWGNLSGGPDANGVNNILLGSVNVVNGNIVGGNGHDVPEPGSLALLGLGLAGLVALRRKQQS